MPEEKTPTRKSTRPDIASISEEFKERLSALQVSQEEKLQQVTTSVQLLTWVVILATVIISTMLYINFDLISKSINTSADVQLAVAQDSDAQPTNLNATVKPAVTTSGSNSDLDYIGVTLSIDGSYTPTTSTPPVDGLPFIGNANAKVTVVEFSDFECPYCRGFYDGVYEQLKKEYIDTNKIKFVYKDFPLYTIHPRASAAANAAHCAAEEGKYYDMHDVLFATFDQWARGGNFKEFLLAQANKLNLDTDAFNTCITNFSYQSLIEQNLSHGYGFGVRGTPTTFVNDQAIRGLVDYNTLKATIEAELAK